MSAHRTPPPKIAGIAALEPGHRAPRSTHSVAARYIVAITIRTGTVPTRPIIAPPRDGPITSTVAWMMRVQRIGSIQCVERDETRQQDPNASLAQRRGQREAGGEQQQHRRRRHVGTDTGGEGQHQRRAGDQVNDNASPGARAIEKCTGERADDQARHDRGERDPTGQNGRTKGCQRVKHDRDRHHPVGQTGQRHGREHSQDVGKAEHTAIGQRHPACYPLASEDRGRGFPSDMPGFRSSHVIGFPARRRPRSGPRI